MTDKDTCFVIMPYGKRRDQDDAEIDFDDVYKLLLRPVVESLDLECERCDQSPSGLIHVKMFEQILNARVALVDISTLNPNVFYELGVRHALRPSATILIRRKGTTIPFNIQDLDVIEYDVDLGSAETAKKKISDAIQNGLTMKRTDSPVHQHLDLRIMRPSRVLQELTVYDYTLSDGSKRRLGMITGDLQHVGRGADAKKIDVWVNSENTNMQMARFFDRSVSAVIRYEGAKKDANGRVLKDTIYDEIRTQVPEGSTQEVQPGTVVVTGAGELERECGVRKIFHVAAVRGEVGHGYSPVQDLGKCVRRALEMADSPKLAAEDLRSILFPLMGTGTARAGKEKTVPVLIDAAVSYLKASPNSKLKEVYFLAWTDIDLEVCQSVIQLRDDLAL